MACNVSGYEGSCVAALAGTDPRGDCSSVDCTGYYHSWQGNTCHLRASVDAIDAGCNGAGACLAAEELCPVSGLGRADVRCHNVCQVPDTTNSCAGTTPGACEGPGDRFEPNNSCAALRRLPDLNYPDAPVYTFDQTQHVPDTSDNDFFHIKVTEGNYQHCECPSGSERYRLLLTVQAPADTGQYRACLDQICGKDANCQTISNPDTDAHPKFAQLPIDFVGSCATTDEFEAFVHVYAFSNPSCEQYDFTYRVYPIDAQSRDCL
ncbi:MAG: hypothetical protein MJE77_12765 [Proteobacteria bacterium]|nr:hypothetical protein [Pseudomonadota bacterium]